MALKVNLGDFELMQIIMTALGFENVSQETSVNKKIFRKDNLCVIVSKKILDE